MGGGDRDASTVTVTGNISADSMWFGSFEDSEPFQGPDVFSKLGEIGEIGETWRNRRDRRVSIVVLNFSTLHRFTRTHKQIDRTGHHVIYLVMTASVVNDQGIGSDVDPAIHVLHTMLCDGEVTRHSPVCRGEVSIFEVLDNAICCIMRRR